MNMFFDQYQVIKNQSIDNNFQNVFNDDFEPIT